MDRLNIHQILDKLYSENNLLEWNTYAYPFYYYIEEKLSRYEQIIKDISLRNFDVRSEDIYFRGTFTKKRLQGLTRRLVEAYIKILQSCYKGDIYYSSKLLYQLLLNSNPKIRQYLEEPYINYFDFSFDMADRVFYRMRDEEIGKSVDCCSHVPFNLRTKIGSNRFSLQGLPCMYLADSKETADSEIGPLEKNKCRWGSEFVPMKEIPTMDLRFRNILNTNITDMYNVFKLLITYPLRLLCSLEVRNKNDSFHEEYYFPQLLSHLVLIYLKEHPNEKLFHGSIGITFDSTKNKGGYNLIIPARYNEHIPPKSGYSEMIGSLFEERNVTIYKTDATPTT